MERRKVKVLDIAAVIATALMRGGLADGAVTYVEGGSFGRTSNHNSGCQLKLRGHWADSPHV